MNVQISAFVKKASLIAGAVLIGWAAQAQTTGGADSTGRHFGMHRSRNGIQYTPQQRQQVTAINKEFHQQSADLFRQDNLTLGQYKAGLLALEKDRKNKLSGVLTPQQKDQLAEVRKRRDEDAQVRGAARLERLKLRLNLNDDQVARLKAGQENLHSQAKAIHENGNLLPSEKREQLRALMAKRNDNFKSVLTPEQYEQFRQLFHRRFGGPHGRRGLGEPGGAANI